MIDIMILLVAVSSSVIITEKLIHPDGLLGVVPTLINRFINFFAFALTKSLVIRINNFIESLIFCAVCVSGWVVIGYSIYLGSFKFGLIHTPIAMYLAYLHTLVRHNFLK